MSATNTLSWLTNVCDWPRYAHEAASGGSLLVNFVLLITLVIWSIHASQRSSAGRYSRLHFVPLLTLVATYAIAGAAVYYYFSCLACPDAPTKLPRQTLMLSLVWPIVDTALVIRRSR